MMSYVDEVIDLVVKKNPAEPEFHQAVKEVLESLRVVVEANEEKFRKMHFWKDLLSRKDSSNSVCHGLTTTDRYMLTQDTVYSSTVRSDLTKEV